MGWMRLRCGGLLMTDTESRGGAENDGHEIAGDEIAGLK